MMADTGSTEGNDQSNIYEEQLQELVALAMAGRINRRTFEREMKLISYGNTLAMFLIGGGEEKNERAAIWLEKQDAIHIKSIGILAAAIFSGEYTKDGLKAGMEAIKSRLVLWVNKGLQALNVGTIYKKPVPGSVEPRFMWKRGGTAAPCKDCLALDGVIKLASEWQKAGIEPQSPQLECGGWNCQCRFVPVR